MKKRIGIIGCGNMGEAILARSLKRKAYKFIIFDKDKLKQAFACRIYGVKKANGITELLSNSDVIIIAVKPQDIDLVLREISENNKKLNNKNILFISIAAGVRTNYIENKLSNKARVIRVMPNLPVTIGKGVSVLCKGRFARREDLKLANDIFSNLGKTINMAKEELIDVVTALSGSGPAYIFFIINAMLVAAKGLGLDRKTANQLIYHMVLGSMELHKEKGFDAERLISQVTSRGGTTEAALKVFRDKKIGAIIMNAILAAHRRAKELCRR